MTNIKDQPKNKNVEIFNNIVRSICQFPAPSNKKQKLKTNNRKDREQTLFGASIDWLQPSSYEMKTMLLKNAETTVHGEANVTVNERSHRLWVPFAGGREKEGNETWRQ